MKRGEAKRVCHHMALKKEVPISEVQRRSLNSNRESLRAKTVRRQNKYFVSLFLPSPVEQYSFTAGKFRLVSTGYYLNQTRFLIKPNNYHRDEDVTKLMKVLTPPDGMAPVAMSSGAAFVREIAVT
jgi:hypothetical protein